MGNTITFPHHLEGFEQNVFATRVETTRSGKRINRLYGSYLVSEGQRQCPKCNGEGHIHGARPMELLDLPFGHDFTSVNIERTRFLCPECGHTWMQDVPFKAAGHFITIHLQAFAHDLLERGLTLKMVSHLTGLGRNTVKDIDKKRLENRYTCLDENGERKLVKPPRQTRILAVDEFKLHDGPIFATIVIDFETGHVLWLAHGKKKQALLDFIEHVGRDWFDTVEAVACDMNSDYQEVFESEFDHIQVVFDYFHIVKNLNDNVISEVRKDEQRRLAAEGNPEAAKALKRTKYILISSEETRLKNDQAAADGKIIIHEGKLFPRMEKKASGGKQERYKELISQNELLFACDLVKETLREAYECRDEAEMADLICKIIDICTETENKHFLWFARLLDNHFEGIIAHATFNCSTGKLEGTNNMIKSIRRQAYGFGDDEYFFLKIMDASYKDKSRNERSHRKSD